MKDGLLPEFFLTRLPMYFLNADSASAAAPSEDLTLLFFRFIRDSTINLVRELFIFLVEVYMSRMFRL